MLYSPDEVYPDAVQAFVEQFSMVRFDDLPKEVVEATKNQVLDFLGVALGGSAEAGVAELRDLVREWGGAEQSTVIRYGDRAPAPNVAQLNATMAHALDFDDVHEDAIMHPGVVTIPTALAMGEYVGGISGQEFITCVVLGTDFICRLGLATRPGENIHKYGWHLTSIYGFLAAAAVAGRILGLHGDRLTSAIGIGYHQSAGNGQAVKDGVLTKRLGPGFAVRGGIVAALLAKRGVTGARNILEGRAGMYHVYHGASFSREILLAEIGERFETMNVSIKPYPCCRGVHPFIDAGLAVATKHDLRPQDIESVLINCGQGTYFLLATPLETKSRPTNPVDSQFSIIWGVATALARRRATLADFSIEAIKSPDILDITAKTTVEVDHSLDRGDVGIEPARVTVTTKSGAVYSEQVDQPTGTPSRPLSFEDVVKKFKSCLAHAGYPISEARADEVIERVSRLDDLADATELVRLLV